MRVTSCASRVAGWSWGCQLRRHLPAAAGGRARQARVSHNLYTGAAAAAKQQTRVPCASVQLGRRADGGCPRAGDARDRASARTAARRQSFPAVCGAWPDARDFIRPPPRDAQGATATRRVICPDNCPDACPVISSSPPPRNGLAAA